MKPAWFLLDDFEHRTDEGKGHCKYQTGIANARASDIVLPFA
jgi:hypothetical protein